MNNSPNFSWCFFLLLFACTHTALAQNDTRFMNTHGSLIALNPSYAGSNGYARLQLSGRTLHSKTNSIVELVNASADLFIQRAGLGIAVGFTDRHYWHYQYTKTLSFTLAKYIDIFDNLTLVPSIQLAGTWNRLDRLLAFIGDPPRVYHWHPDVNAGFLLRNAGKFTVGAYGFHFTQPYVDLGYYTVQNRLRLLLHGTYTLVQNNKHLIEISGRHMWQDTDKTDDLAINAVLFNRAIVGAGYGLIQFGKIREDWPILNLGYRAGKASFMITLNPIFGRNGMFWSAGEVHASFNLSKFTRMGVVQSFEQF